jgi:hypothetical protein
MKKFYLILVVGALLSSCKKDVMDRTIFIPDEEDPTLPAYTEWGYNSFGAEYERDYFLVSNAIEPCKIIYSNNQLQFALFGTVGSEKEKMTLQFIFPSTPIQDFQDLVQLNNQKIDLSNSSCMVKIIQNNKDTIFTGVSGELYFKRAQLLSIDDKVNRVILSGTFELQFLQNGFPAYISNGRFDVGITK